MQTWYIMTLRHINLLCIGFLNKRHPELVWVRRMREQYFVVYAWQAIINVDVNPISEMPKSAVELPGVIRAT